MAGAYRASPSQLTVEVKEWGEHCGPRPQSRTDPEQPTVKVQSNGKQLTLTFPDRTLRSDACWSPNLLVKPVASSVDAGRYRLECRTPQGEAKRERGVYTISAGTDLLELHEESDYDWQLKSSHCVAKVRMTQRLVRQGSKLEPAPAAPSASEPEEPEAPKGCTPGALAKLRLRPASARLSPGQRVCFIVRAFDAAGCALPNAGSLVRWELQKRPATSGTLSGGCFKAAASAAEAEGRFEISVSSGSARDVSVVDVVPADLSDITARRGTAVGAPSEEPQDPGISSDFGIEAAVKRSSWGVILAGVALLLAVLATVGALLTRRGRASQTASPKSTAPERPPHRPEPQGGSLPANLTPSSAREQLICPRCRRGYADGTTRCPHDGETPIPYAEFVRQAQEREQPRRTCGACGAQLAPGALFCGACGAKVQA